MVKLAPLVALRTFIEIFRQGNMKKAAQNLCVSAAAVSQQLRGLEDKIGYKLFVRDTKGLCLTQAGLNLFERLSNAIDIIDTAWMEVSGRVARYNRLVINTTTAIASLWLIPRLAVFSNRWPDIEVSVEVDLRLSELRTDRFDIAITNVPKNIAGYTTTALWSSSLMPVCNPTFLDNRAPLGSVYIC